MEKIFCIDKTEGDQKAVDLIVDSLKSLLQSQDKVVLAIPGGRSVSGIFSLLKEQELPWPKIHLFWVDERMVHLTDAESNYRLAKETFLDHLVQQRLIPPENIHPFDVQKGIVAYQKELELYGGRYDVILLSSGEDGHAGALFPNHHSILDQSKFFLIMDDSPKPPPARMTMSASLAKKAQVGLILFYGEAKRSAWEKFNDHLVDVSACPAKLVYLMKEGYAVTDLR